MKKISELMPEAYDFNGKLPLKQAIPLGLQHVMAMFVGNLTPLLIITGACGIGAGSEYASVQVALLQNAMIIAGIVTLIQLFAIGPIGGKVPIIMGTSSGFIGVFSSVTKIMCGGVLAYGALMGASIIGGLFETVLGAFIKPLRRFFPSVVTGTVVLSIGLSLISVGINSFGGGNSAKDFGSLENLFLAFVVLVVILFFKHWTKGYISSSAILIGIIVGYIVAFIMGLVLPHIAVSADGVEYTKVADFLLKNILHRSLLFLHRINMNYMILTHRMILFVFRQYHIKYYCNKCCWNNTRFTKYKLDCLWCM